MHHRSIKPVEAKAKKHSMGVMHGRTVDGSPSRTRFPSPATGAPRMAHSLPIG